MNNKDFIKELSQRTGYSKEDTEKLVQSMTNVIGDNLDEEGDSAVVPAFGTFYVKKHRERVVTNPVSGQRMLVPPKYILSFRPSQVIREQLKNGGADEETRS